MKSESEIREELKRVRQDAVNGNFSREIRANAQAMAMVLEWMLGEK